MKPFIGTLRVTNPVRQSRASSRKRVLRGDGRPSLRSVDSEIKRCVIEPRNNPRGEPSPWSIAGAAPGISDTWTHQRAWSHRGRRNMANDQGVPRELGRPCRFLERPDGEPAYQLQDDPSAPRPRPTGTNEGRNRYRQAKETKCGERRQGVAVPHSSVEAGERPFRTPWSEGGAALWTGGWNHAEDIVPHQRVTAKRPSRARDSDIHNVTNRMRLTRTSGSVGAPGVIPGATRPRK